MPRKLQNTNCNLWNVRWLVGIAAVNLQDRICVCRVDFGLFVSHQLATLDTLVRNKHIANLQGKEYILFSGLLWLAHRNGLKSIDTDLIEHDRENGFCLVKARVTGERGEFTAYGDADQITCGKKVASAYIRMSETRAVARALRFYTGTGMTALEELPNG